MYILTNLNQIFPITLSEFETFISVEIYIEKNCCKWSIWLRCRKAHSFETIRDVNPKFWKQNLYTWMKVMSKFHVSIILYLPKNKPSNNITVGLGQVYFSRIYNCLNVVEATHIWLLTETSASLTRKNVFHFFLPS